VSLLLLFPFLPPPALSPPRTLGQTPFNNSYNAHTAANAVAVEQKGQGEREREGTFTPACWVSYRRLMERRDAAALFVSSTLCGNYCY